MQIMSEMGEFGQFLSRGGQLGHSGGAILSYSLALAAFSCAKIWSVPSLTGREEKQTGRETQEE